MQFFKTEWGQGTLSAAAMGVIIAFPQALNFFCGALLLHKTMRHYMKAFKAIKPTIIMTPPTVDHYEVPYEVVDSLPAGDGPLAIRL